MLRSEGPTPKARLKADHTPDAMLVKAAQRRFVKPSCALAHTKRETKAAVAIQALSGAPMSFLLMQSSMLVTYWSWVDLVHTVHVNFDPSRPN